MILKRLCFASITFTFFSCSRADKISITKVGELNFRRSYASFMNSFEKPNDTTYVNYVLDSLEKEKPTILSPLNELQKKLKSTLTKAGLVKGDSLLLDKVYAITSTDTIRLKSETGNDFKITTGFDTILLKQMLFIIGKDKYEKIDLEASNPVTLHIMNLFNGAYQDIIILSEWYIMNGDMYDISVYHVN